MKQDSDAYHAETQRPQRRNSALMASLRGKKKSLRTTASLRISFEEIIIIRLTRFQFNTK